jgi:hypothetical protein
MGRAVQAPPLFLVQEKFGSPTISKDGISVVKEIDLKDPVENLGARMVREVASKTSDIAGAGDARPRHGLLRRVGWVRRPY